MIPGETEGWSAHALCPAVPLWAGFECGHLGWCDQDLLVGTRHTPATDMRKHYADALALGVRVARDGLPWRHDPGERVAAIPPGMRVIWDLCHFDPPERPELHAIRCARALGAGASILAVNEPSMWPLLCRRPRSVATAAAKRMMGAVALHMEARFYTCDPMHGLEEREFAATDELVATGHVAVVGVNYYPHEARAPLREVLAAAWRRYGLPLALTETSWHRGHRRAVRRFPAIGNCQHAWLAHVRAEIAASGAPVEGVCWYPWLDQPVWGRPRSRARWPCGFPQRPPSLE